MRKQLPKVRGIFEKTPGSGVWWVRYADGAGKIRREVGGSREGAGILYRKRKTDVLQGRKIPESLRKGEVSFNDLAELVRHYSGASGEHCPRHQATIRQHLRRLEGWWGDRAAESILPSEIENRLAAHAKTVPTFNRYRATLSLAYKLGIRDGLVRVNPAHQVKQSAENSGRIRFLSEAEEAKLRKVIRETCPEREPEFDLALYTGARRSEQYGMLWRDVDFANEIITIPKSKHRRVRYIRLNSAARRTLQAFLPFRQGEDSPVCPGGMGRKGYRHRWFFEIVAKAGLADVVWHTLRHTYISRLAARGVDIASVKELAGHHSMSTTMKYIHLTPEHLREAAEKAAPQVGTDTKTDTRPKKAAQKPAPYIV